MEIVKTKEEGKLNIALTGRLDTTTAPELETSLREDIDEIKELTFDFKDLDYISSAGLRVILFAQKTMNMQGSMEVINVCDDIKEIFDITGFSDILTIK